MAKNFSNSIRKFEPLIAKFCDLNLKNNKMLKHEDELYFKKSLFDKIPSISIDVVIMERSNNIQYETLNCGWMILARGINILKFFHKIKIQ